MKMQKRNCPVCSGTWENSAKFLSKKILQEKINEFSYSSRKLPEFMRHELVECNTCDLVYAIEPPSQIELAKAYHQADFDTATEAEDAAQAYINSLKFIFSKNYKSVLEIGAGTGVFLEKLKENGFDSLIGIEPSTAAINAAPEHRKKWLIEDIFKGNMFESNTFDMVCCFMTMEHVKDPGEIVEAALKILKDEGTIALVVHDRRAMLNKILGEKSPIIDIEHMQLFSKKSIRYLLEKNGFNNIKVKSFRNCYSISYWIRLLPINNWIKSKIINTLVFMNISDVKISINVGNLMVTGTK
jgi:2-polyprenyl-3-methyl-5-hydroxy-6-metoxy-1,4-benzoquinol methylase